MAEDIVLSPTSLHHSSFSPSTDTPFQDERLQRGAQTTWGWVKFATFDWNHRLSQWYEIGPWLLWNVNRKSFDGSIRVSFDDLEWPWRRDTKVNFFRLCP